MIRRLLVIAVCLAVVSTAAGIAAKGPKSRITWTPARIDQVVTPGQTVQISASFVSGGDLSNVTLTASGGLGKVLAISPAAFASLKAGEVARVTLTVSIPAGSNAGKSGTIKVKADTRTLPQSLKVHLKVPGQVDKDK